LELKLVNCKIIGAKAYLLNYHINIEG